MANLPPNPALVHFIKPTLETPFHIDYNWWDQNDLDINIQLRAHLPIDLREAYAGQRVDDKIDLVDWDTGEVQQVEGLQYIIATQSNQDPAYVMQAPTLLEAIFRVFLSNGNQPLTAKELSPLVGHPPERVLRVLSGRRVRKGLRPILEE